jgi:ubiquinone/menaquinone biosynthesis C-methylase UbiE
MKKGVISNFLRKLGLLQSADYIRFWAEKFRNRKKNRSFLSNNPGVKLPPDYLIYESFQLDYQKYFTDSEDTARWLADLLKKNIELNDVKILDWCCGPGRVLRHLSKFTGPETEFFGTDYNADSIAWCSEYLHGIQFNQNSLKAELPYESNFFDVIYGISVFTHLSEKMHFAWMSELMRVLKIGGIMLFTTQGEIFREKLTTNELTAFDEGNLVIRGHTKEGHRTYSAFHPKKFMEELFAQTEILEHIERKPDNGGWLPQDVWILKKERINEHRRTQRILPG